MKKLNTSFFNQISRGFDPFEPSLYLKLLTPHKQNNSSWLRKTFEYITTLFWRVVFFCKTGRFYTDKRLICHLSRHKDGIKINQLSSYRQLYRKFANRISKTYKYMSQLRNRLVFLEDLKSTRKGRLAEVKILINETVSIETCHSWVLKVRKNCFALEELLIGSGKSEPEILLLKKKIIQKLKTTLLLIKDKQFQNKIESLIEFMSSSRVSLSLTNRYDWKIHKYEVLILNIQSLFTENVDYRKLFRKILSCQVDQYNMKRYSKKYLSELRVIYNQFIKSLHYKLKQNPCNPTLHMLCKRLFTGASLEKESFSLLKKFNQIGGGQGRDVDLIQRLSKSYRNISLVPRKFKTSILASLLNDFKGHFNVGFDPFSQGNPIHVLYCIQTSNKKIKAIGCGSPTREMYWGKSCLNQIFIGFLKAYASHGKRHLFVLNQTISPRSILKGDESKRSKLILDLQNKDEFFDTFYAVALSKNSDFYYQSGRFAKNVMSLSFKNEIMTQLFASKNFHIPQKIINLIPDIEVRLKSIVDHIHSILFDDKISLERHERRLFIEFVYTSLTLFLIQKLNVDSFNITCKDGIDRAAGSNSLLYAYLISISGLLNRKEHKLRLESLMMSRALFVRKRPPRLNRLNLFLKCFRFACLNKVKLRKFHAKVFGDLPTYPFSFRSLYSKS